MRLAAKIGALLSIAFITNAGAAEKVVIQNGSPVPGVAYVEFYVAKHAGFFAEEGLDVEIRYSQGAPQATQIAASNGADMGFFGFEPYLQGYASGMRGKFYYAYGDHNLFFIAVPENSDIKSIADLKGKKIGVSNMGSGSLIIARAMLRSAGIDPVPQMFVPVGIGEQARQALNSGQVDALSLWDFAYANLQRSGLKFRFFQHPEVGQINNQGIFISDAAVKANREKAIKLLRALVKSRIFIRENLDAALRIYWKENPAAKQGSSEKDAYEKGMAEMVFMSPIVNKTAPKEIGRFDIRGMAKYLDVMRQEGVLKGDLVSEDFVSNDLISAIGEIDPEPIKKRAREWK